LYSKFIGNSPLVENAAATLFATERAWFDQHPRTGGVEHRSGRLVALIGIADRSSIAYSRIALQSEVAGSS
jgi:hypothetical protein